MKSRSWLDRCGTLSCLAIGCLAACATLLGATLPADLFSQLEYRHIGPMGNRVSAVVGVAGDANTYYIGAASGGVFKTADAGASWTPVFDDQPAQSIGALAIAPSDPNVVWAGTGEAHIRSNISIGNGVYRSTDGGKSWTHMGLEESGRISRIVIHPENPDIVLVAVLGHCYGPQSERGVYRTRDGGETWEQVLFTDQNSGASDLVMDPLNPRILFAGMWQMQIWTWGRESGGPGSGLFRSRDGGTTWTRLSGRGLPQEPWGKVALSMTAAQPGRIFALIETNSNEEFADLQEHQGVLWRSDDSGENWRLVNSDHTLAQRPHYYSRVVAAPDDEGRVYFLSTQASISLDGGHSYDRFPVAGDHHDMWIDPLMPRRMIVGHDQGISISTTQGRSWLRPQLPIAQMYHVYTDNRIPYKVYGNRQDGPSMAGPSNTLNFGPIPIGAWHTVGGCESGFAIPDPVNPDIVWSGCYEGILDRYDASTGHSRDVSVWPDNAEAWAGKDLKYRFQWTFPVAISPHDHNRVYVGSQYVHMTEDGGQSWRVISPDLSTNDKSKQERFGGLTPDDAGPTIAAVLFALAESPVEQGVLWAGTNDGLLHVSRDGGQRWKNVTGNIPGLPPWGTVSNIEPSRFKAGTAYITVDLHQVNDTRPYVYKTTDYGANWTSLSGTIPHSVFSYAHCIREDPVREGLLYLGTENSVYVSLDDGGQWHPLQNNLPHAPAHWLTVQEHFNDLVVATYGRGFWILDDITPLQQLSNHILESKVHLFTPRPAYRFRQRESHMQQPGDPVVGQNPHYGATIHFLLEDSAAGPVQIEIADSQGTVVRRLNPRIGSAGTDDEDAASDDPGGSVEGGLASRIHRVQWNLRRSPTGRPKLRTKPRQHSHVSLGDPGYRELGEGGRFAPLVAPGDYTVRLTVGEETRTTSLRVLKDPHSAGSLPDLEAQYEVLSDLYQMIETAVGIIDELESTRSQLLDLAGRLRGDETHSELRRQAVELEKRLADLENNFFDLRLTNARQDTLWWGRRLYSKLLSLSGMIHQSDFQPTDQQVEVYRMYKGQLEGHQQEWNRLKDGDLADLNKALRDQQIPHVGPRP